MAPVPVPMPVMVPVTVTVTVPVTVMVASPMPVMVMVPVVSPMPVPVMVPVMVPMPVMVTVMSPPPWMIRFARSFVSERIGRRDARRFPGRVNRGQQTHQQRGHDDARHIGPAHLGREVGDEINIDREEFGVEQVFNRRNQRLDIKRGDDAERAAAWRRC